MIQLRQMRGFSKLNVVKRPPELGSALVERLLSSSEFVKSPRLSELLRYLWECACKDPSSIVSEHQIGVAIYDWNRDSSPGTDPIVRVQISQLRKKLEHYFATEGRMEPDILVIPRGSYTPVLQPREDSPFEIAAAAAKSGSPPSRWQALVGTAVLSAVVAVGITLAIQRFEPAAPREPAAPSLDRLWKVFQGPRPVQIVLSDSSLLLLQDILGQPVPLHLYRSSRYPSELLAAIPNADTRKAAVNVVGMEITGTQDSAVCKKIDQLSTRYAFSTTIISARNVGMPQTGNVILLGHNKANPWIELFEDRLNFRYEFDYKKGIARIVNREPRPGERPSYPAVFGEHGYCVVALLAKPMNDGVALLIFGSDVSSLAAGGQLVSDERSLSSLYSQIQGASANEPYFEALLETRLLGSQAPEFHIVAVRPKPR